MVRCRLSMKIKYNKLQNSNYVTVNDREETVLEATRRNKRHISIRKTDGLCSGVVQKLFSTLFSIAFSCLLFCLINVTFAFYSQRQLMTSPGGKMHAQ